MSFNETYVATRHPPPATRRQLRGVAESLIAGPHYGVSPGDDHHPTPYAYVGPWTKPTGPFWNAPFGALCPLNPAHDVDALTSRIADFFERGRKELHRDR